LLFEGLGDLEIDGGTLPEELGKTLRVHPLPPSCSAAIGNTALSSFQVGTCTSVGSASNIETIVSSSQVSTPTTLTTSTRRRRGNSGIHRVSRSTRAMPSAEKATGRNGLLFMSLRLLHPRQHLAAGRGKVEHRRCARSEFGEPLALQCKGYAP